MFEKMGWKMGALLAHRLIEISNNTLTYEHDSKHAGIHMLLMCWASVILHTSTVLAYWSIF